MNKKTTAGTGSVIFGVAFVWFTTHFGGGFASGAQIYSYYVRFGIWCLLMPALAMLYNGIFFAYGMRFARKHEVYDYRSYNNAFYGKFAPVFSNLFEVLYICVMCVAPAVAFATGGATLSTLTGLPYLLCTLIIGIFIFIVAIFGTDLVRRIAYSGKDYLLQIQQRESELTEIPSLKIGYNNVFGYYIEVRNTHKDKVPAEWIRKQTLANAERYITQELKEYEEKILGAEDKILVLETQLYAELVQSLSEFIPAIQINANQIARLDCLLSFATAARENNYIRPVIADDDVLEIHQGRHPVIEKQLPIGEKYIANDVMLDSQTQQIIIITGPNMAGKSALLRQTALITLLAQIGSFVPAESAHIGLVDKIFTRVGASDNISVGESTFMVEMNEAADILNNLSPRSLVLFDELGRGTSTYDGISIAWAIVEHIHEHPKAKARTLFATHYHELNEMEKSFKRIKNYNVSVKEIDNKVIFLRKLERGGSEHSFGIHVAKMAGMPKSIVKRAGDILKQLEKDNRQQGIAAKPMVEVG